MSRNGGSNTLVHERLRRLLLVVPVVSKNQGISVQALSDQLGIAKSELLEDLDLLTLVGKPPFQPDDYIDIYVEDDRVFVELDARFLAPPRLTVSEAVALTAAAQLLDARSQPSLQSALEKLEKVIPVKAKEQLQATSKQIHVTTGANEAISTLSHAISQCHEVQFEYTAGHSGKSEPRIVRPTALRYHRGHWYLTGHCLSRNDERVFRVDRILSLRETDRRFESPRTSEADRTQVATAPTATVRFSKRAALYIQERFAGQAHTLPSGEVEVVVPADSERWLTTWIMSFGGEAWVKTPLSLRKSVATMAAMALKSR